MSTIEVADVGFIAGPAVDVAARLADRRAWRRWWPNLQLTVTEDRGAQGIRWTVTGELIGTMEFWLRDHLDGVLVHYFLHAEPQASNPVSDWRDAAERIRKHRVVGREIMLTVKFAVEDGRAAGDPAVKASVPLEGT